MSTDNYYKDLWNNPNTEAGQFFNKTDFNHKDYKRQEQVFRNFLKGLKAVKALYKDQKPIESVLEVGAGTGRITKIMWEEFPDIEDYVVTDINEENLKQIGNHLNEKQKMLTCPLVYDIMELDFPEKNKFDLVLASEVFMHIKPEDISKAVKILTNFLAPNAVIINIDWYHQPEPSTWCYIHDYEKMYRENGLYPMFEATINKQKLFCYGK